MVIPSSAFDLDVLSQHVEAHFFDLCQLIDDGFIIGVCQKSVTGIALIEQAAEEQRFMVQAEALPAFLIGFHGDPAHAEIALDRIVFRFDIQRHQHVLPEILYQMKNFLIYFLCF